MEYTVITLSRISGVSSRTLRYYDQIGLLKPAKTRSNGYRIYTDEQVDLLQQILFYRELGIGLSDIQNIVHTPGFEREKALESHLLALQNEKRRIEILAINVEKTLHHLRGESTMKAKEKFEGFKRSLIDENEKKYGTEARGLYGDESVDAAHARLAGMDERMWQSTQQLSEQVNTQLKAAVIGGDPASATAQEVCRLHGEWLQRFWGEGKYSKQAHASLGEMYVADERFSAYYEAIAPGAAVFLRDALKIYAR